MKITKAKERCSQVLALNVQFLGARANWIYNLGVVSERKKCVNAWKKLSEKNGACGGSQQRSLAKFEKVYERFDPIKSSEKVGQFVDYIERLSGENKGCKGFTLKSKEFNCGIFVKRLRKGHVICEYKDGPRKTTSIDNNLYYFVDSLTTALEEFLIPKAHAGMWDELRSMTGAVSTGLVDHDQRLAPYIYDPMVRGVTYQAIIDKKKETAGVYDKIVLENYGRAGVVNDLKSELDSTKQTTGAILQGVLDIDPKNPTALTEKNLEALDLLSVSINKCTYGALPDGACKEPHKKWNEFYGKGEGQTSLTDIFNPNLSAHRATALTELARGRVFSKKMNAAMRALDKENKDLSNDKRLQQGAAM
jgi:hypothetical protein